MKKRWGLGIGCVVAILVSAAANPRFEDYQAGYESRLAKAETAKDVTFLTTRYDGALAKLQEQFSRGGNTEKAAAVWAERERIRGLDKVLAAGVALKPLLQEIQAQPRRAGAPSAEIEFFGIKETCSRPVFLLHAGPAMLQDRGNPERGRVRFDVFRNRVIDAVQRLPEGTEFNAALFWASITCPFSTEPMSSSGANNPLFNAWISPVNMLSSKGHFGDVSLSRRLSELKWPSRLDTSALRDQPKWVHNYKVGPALMTGDGLTERSYNHWVRAICFAFEQQADAVFIVTPNFMFSPREKEKEILDAIEGIMEALYGKQGNNHPELHIVMAAGTGRASFISNGARSVENLFDGELVVVDDVEDWMSDEEKELFDSF